MDELKPCPFCGSSPWLHSYKGIFVGEIPYRGDIGYRVECEGECHAMTCYWHSKDEAIKAWNKRYDT